MSRALVIGAGGQDGTLLTASLAGRGWRVDGVTRGELNLCSAACVKDALSREYDHVYYLAAHHHSSQDSTATGESELFKHSSEIHVEGLFTFLDGIRTASPSTKLFYAASSLVFGSPNQDPQNESTPFDPLCIYGITKTTGIHLCRYFREKHGIFASVGILFNHESPLRQRKFVIPKILHSAIAISRGSKEKLHLGDLSARVDWGYAPDYVDAMHRILCLDRPDDFAVATGETHSVQEVVEIAFDHLGLDWREHVVESPSILTRRRTALRGDSSKLRQATGWQPSLAFQPMILRLLEAAQHA